VAQLIKVLLTYKLPTLPAANPEVTKTQNGLENGLANRLAYVGLDF